MPNTQNQRALGESLDDDGLSPCSQQRLAAVQAAELERIDADRQYNDATLAASVVVYGNGKKFEAVVPAIRRNNKDRAGSQTLSPRRPRADGSWKVITDYLPCSRFPSQPVVIASPVLWLFLHN